MANTFNKLLFLHNIFERKVYRILVPVYDKQKRKMENINQQRNLYAMVKKPTVTDTIMLNRLRWFGHEQRMEENRIPKKYCI
jgi:hypothetical protein